MTNDQELGEALCEAPMLDLSAKDVQTIMVASHEVQEAAGSMAESDFHIWCSPAVVQRIVRQFMVEMVRAAAAAAAN
jgi:hypothetical protein